MPKYFPAADDVNKNKSCDILIEHGLPIFFVRCIKKIETMINTDGLYRINGDFDGVQKLRYVPLLDYLLPIFYYAQILIQNDYMSLNVFV